MKTNSFNLLHQLQQLASENALLKVQLEEQQHLGFLHENKLRELKFGNEAVKDAISRLDDKGLELEILQADSDALKKRQAGALDREENLHQQLLLSIRKHHQLQDLQQHYLHLQTQYLDLQLQLEEANKRIFLLLQNNNHEASSCIVANFEQDALIQKNGSI